MEDKKEKFIEYSKVKKKKIEYIQNSILFGTASIFVGASSILNMTPPQDYKEAVFFGAISLVSAYLSRRNFKKYKKSEKEVNLLEKKLKIK